MAFQLSHGLSERYVDNLGECVIVACGRAQEIDGLVNVSDGEFARPCKFAAVEAVSEPGRVVWRVSGPVGSMLNALVRDATCYGKTSGSEVDGGGVRGLVALLMLRRLMHLIDPKDPPKPCRVFDVIAGTSTGGLLAIMLGRLEMDIETTIAKYCELSKVIFTPRRRVWFGGRLLQNLGGTATFSSEILEQSIKTVIEAELGNNNIDAPLLQEEPKCKIFLCACLSNAEAHRLRNYKSQSEEPMVCTIWEAARATSAAPTFFDPITFSNGLVFRDGGLRNNNPIFELVNEIQREFASQKISTIVSLGTGVSASINLGERLVSIGKACAKIATDTETTADRFAKIYCSPGGQFRDRYFRFNVTQGLQEVGLEEWQKRDLMWASTLAYMKSPEQQEKLDRCADRLRDTSEITAGRAPIKSERAAGRAQAGFPLPPKRATEEIEFLKCLNKGDYESYRRRNPEPAEGTCKWFLKHEKYQLWLRETNSSFLWVSGDPESGKSVFASFLVDELRRPESQSILPGTVCHFFFKDDDEVQRSATHALSGLLYQFFTSNETGPLLRHAVRDIQNNGKEFAKEVANLSGSWRILTTAATDPRCGNFICILDGLDECEDPKAFINEVVQFYQDHGRNDRAFLKIIVTSRPYSFIELGFKSLSNIRLRVEDESKAVSDDIEVVIKARVIEIGRSLHLTEKVQTDLAQRLIGNSDRTFLWVKLIFDEIQTNAEKGEFHGTERDIQRALESTSSYDVYEKILDRSSKNQPELARKILSIIVTAVRPLTVAEMNTALAIQPGDKSVEDLKDIFPNPEASIKNICGLFVRIIESKIYLVHQTAKQYLIKHIDNSNAVLGPWKHSLDPIVSNRILAEICTWYLMFTVFESHPLIANGSLLEYNQTVNQYTEKHSFLDYAAKHWAFHFREAKVRDDMAVFISTLDVCNTQSKRFHTWFQVYWATLDTLERCPKVITNLAIASYFGHNVVAKFLLQRGADLESESDPDGRTPLSWAARSGHLGVVKLLVEKGANLESEDSYGQTPLWWAADRGNLEVIELLVEGGADLESKDSSCSLAPLSWAAESGHLEVVKLLVEKGANLESKDSNGQTPLSWVARNGHLEVVKLLVEKGADLESKNCNGQTPLSRAARSGHLETVELLVEKGANLESKNRNGQTPLWLAAGNGHLEVVKLLVEKGTDLESKDSYGLTPLWCASVRGHTEVAKLLKMKIKDRNNDAAVQKLVEDMECKYDVE